MGYDIIDNKKIESHITFIRIDPKDIKATLKEVFESLSNLSWLNDFDKKYAKDSFQVRAEVTIDHIRDKIIREDDDKITSDSGEYVISELSRKALIKELAYSDIPLAELIKEQKSGNPGFDFYSVSQAHILLFGEAKYLASRNSYGRAFEQIVNFIGEARDVADLLDIDKFCSPESLENVSQKKKGYIAAFASKTITTEDLIKNIKENAHFKEIAGYDEVICVAVNI